MLTDPAPVFVAPLAQSQFVRGQRKKVARPILVAHLAWPASGPIM